MKRHSLDPNGTTSLILVGFIGSVAFYNFLVLPVVVSSLISGLGLGEDVAGNIASANTAGLALMSLCISVFIQRWALHRIAAAGLIAMITFDFAAIFAAEAQALAVLRFASGLGGGAVLAAVAAAIARLPVSDKGYGVYIASQFVWPSIGLYFLPILTDEVGLIGLFGVFTIINLIALIVSPVLKPYVVPASSSIETGAMNSSIALIGRPVALVAIAALSIYGAANGSFWAFAELTGIANGVGENGVALGLSAANFLGIIGAILVILIQDRFGHIRPIAFGIAGQIIALVLLVKGVSGFGFFVALTIFTMNWAFAWSYFYSKLAQIDRTGSVVAAGNFTNIVGNAVGPVAAGWFAVGGNLDGVNVLSILLLGIALAGMVLVGAMKSA